MKLKNKGKRLMEKEVVVVGISGASGVESGVNFCNLLKSLNYEPLVVITKSAEIVAELETGILLSSRLRRSGIKYYNQDDIGASIASGSFQNKGMIMYPCSINTLSKIANSINDNLVIRAADVTLKEGRKLILVVRETPFHVGHLKMMERVCKIGAIVMPMIFSFYGYKDETLTLEKCFNNFNGRVLDRFGINNNITKRWKS